MTLARSLRHAALVLGCLSTSAALAIPNIQPCASYRSWSSGAISFADIAFENNPHPVSESSAKTSATGRCYGLWLQRGGNPLTYANAGSIVQVWQSTPGYYQYQCLICSNARPPGKFWWYLDAATAVEMAHSKLDGKVLAVDARPRTEGDQVYVNYEVSIVRDDHIARVFVDGRTGQVVVPEVTSSATVYPDTSCK